MGILSDSDSLCRLCGLSSPETVDIFSQDGLSSDLCFYLPLEVSCCHFLTLVVEKRENQFSSDQGERAFSQETV